MNTYYFSWEKLSLKHDFWQQQVVIVKCEMKKPVFSFFIIYEMHMQIQSSM